MSFSNLDELYNEKTVDEVLLRDYWKNIIDIIVDSKWSMVKK